MPLAPRAPGLGRPSSDTSSPAPHEGEDAPPDPTSATRADKRTPPVGAASLFFFLGSTLPPRRDNRNRCELHTHATLAPAPHVQPRLSSHCHAGPVGHANRVTPLHARVHAAHRTSLAAAMPTLPSPSSLVQKQNWTRPLPIGTRTGLTATTRATPSHLIIPEPGSPSTDRHWRPLAYISHTSVL